MHLPPLPDATHHSHVCNVKELIRASHVTFSVSDVNEFS
jgi:hypothetical protein